MGMYNKMNKAKASGDKKPRLPPGFFTTRIDVVKGVDGYEGDHFIVIEFEVLKTSTDEAETGKMYSQVIKWNQNMGPINVKRFLLCAGGYDPNDEDNEDKVDEDDLEFALSDEQPLKGLIMEVQVDLIETKKNTEFSKHTWFPVDEDEQEEGSDEEEDEEEED